MLIALLTLLRLVINPYIRYCSSSYKYSCYLFVLLILGDVFLFHTDGIISTSQPLTFGMEWRLVNCLCCHMSRHVMSWIGVLQSMQRTFTKSDYDHVGIVVRVPPHSRSDLSLFILEATSDGVKKYPLRLRLFAWWISKAHISWRRLNVVRNFENMQKLGLVTSPICLSSTQRPTPPFHPLQITYSRIFCGCSDFVTEVDGLPYSLTPLKFIRYHTWPCHPLHSSLT
jgi:hypothetical protein